MQASRFISPFRTLTLPTLTVLLVTSAALAMSAQNSVPPTAAEASKVPQFAAHLASSGAASRPNPAPARQRSHRSPDWPNNLYENGPINGNLNAWTINSGYAVSDTFTVTERTTISGISFGAWLVPGDVLGSAEVSFTSSPNGGQNYFDENINFTQDSCSQNPLGYRVCTETSEYSSFFTILDPGTYWVNVQNAVGIAGQPVYWDENGGVGCNSPGCPSQAQQSEVGTIPSESFAILGPCSIDEKPMPRPAAVTVPRSPTQTYRVIYNFTGGQDGGNPFNGLTIDAAGNLYGVTGSGGPSNAGTVFKLSPSPSGWRYTRVYSFSGPNGGGPDSTPILGADGRLYGATYGGGLGDGVVFGLSPSGRILPSVFSNWMQTLLYSFSGGSDGAHPGGNLVVDGSNNIYGTASLGTNHGGTLYEVANGGLQVLHAFPAYQDDGIAPLGVFNGSDGLYGITSQGGTYNSGTLYTTAGGYQVLHSFNPGNYEGHPVSLATDQAGNLYGSSQIPIPCGLSGGMVFQSSPPDWNLSPLTSFGFGLVSSWITTDATGNIYGTTDFAGQYDQGNVFQLTCCWNYSDLHDFSGYPNDGEEPSSSPLVDAHGNIYGTTSNGGAYFAGVVWEISP